MPPPAGRAVRVRAPERDVLVHGPDLEVARLAGAEWGVLSAAELRGCGLSPQAIATRARNGRLHHLHRGVYAVGHSRPPREGLFLAAVKACGPEAWLSGFAATAHWELLDWDRDRYPEVTVRGVGTRGHPGIRMHRSTRLDALDVTRHRGVPVTTPERTLVDLAGEANRRALRAAVRRAQALHRVSPGGILDALARAGRRRGAGKLIRILATGPAPTRSELEDVVLDLILRGGLAHPDVNVPLVLEGRTIIPDFRWPGERLIVEADGERWHGGAVARADDAERQALLEAAGERVLRVTWRQAVAAAARTLARLRAAGAPAAV